MPTLSHQTPVPRLVLIAQDVAEWHRRHKVELDDILGTGANFAEECERIAAQLEAAQTDYDREVDEDRGVTVKKASLVESGQNYLRTARAATELTIGEHSDAAQAILEAGGKRPSEAVTSIRTAREDVDAVVTTLKTHRDKIEPHLPRFERVLEQGENLRRELHTINEDEVREYYETNQADLDRQELVEALIEKVKQAQLAAQVHYADDPKMLAELGMLFAEHNPDPDETLRVDEVIREPDAAQRVDGPAPGGVVPVESDTKLSNIGGNVPSPPSLDHNTSY